MAFTPEQERILGELKLLRHIQFTGMKREERERLSESIELMELSYKKSIAESEDKNKTEAERKRAKEAVDAVSKAVPGIVKGALTATAAFQKGDALTGTAGIMDICASAIGLLSLAGPQGALIGALGGAIFSSISQILSFFAPKQPSLKDQIDELLSKHEALSKIADLKGVSYSIAEYTGSLEYQCKYLGKTLDTRLGTTEEVEVFVQALNTVNFALQGIQSGVNISKFENWKVAGWITQRENQSYELWPQVLGMWTQAYTDIFTANTLLDCLASPSEITRLTALTKPANNPDVDRKELRAAKDKIVDLVSIIESSRQSWKQANRVALGILREVTNTAITRGLYSQIGTEARLYLAVGKEGKLGWSKKSGDVQGLSINVPAGRLDFVAPAYEILTVSPTSARDAGVRRSTIFPTKGDFSGGPVVLKQGTKYGSEPDGRDARLFSDCVDVSWMPSNESATVARVYTAHSQPKGGYNYINIHHVSPDDKVWRINWEPPGMRAKLTQVRALYAPVEPLSDDPDGQYLPPYAEHGVYDLIYGGYNTGHTIWCGSNILNSWAEVPTPLSGYRGIAVDANFVWVFGVLGFACATHASIQGARSGKTNAARWITYLLNPADFTEAFPKMKPEELKRMVETGAVNSLYPCADGTLNAALKLRSESFWTTNFNVDLTAHKIKVSQWADRGSEPTLIHKMPIPCWTLYEGLKINLLLDQFSSSAQKATTARKAPASKARKATASAARRAPAKTTAKAAKTGNGQRLRKR